MSWNIPQIDALESQDRKDPPKPPDNFELLPNESEPPAPAPVSMTGIVSFYDVTDRRVIESLDIHAEEVSTCTEYIKLYIN